MAAGNVGTCTHSARAGRPRSHIGPRPGPHHRDGCDLGPLATGRPSRELDHLGLLRGRACCRADLRASKASRATCSLAGRGDRRPHYPTAGAGAGLATTRPLHPPRPLRGHRDPRYSSRETRDLRRHAPHRRPPDRDINLRRRASRVRARYGGFHEPLGRSLVGDRHRDDSWIRRRLSDDRTGQADRDSAKAAAARCRWVR
jgi:hypothetical protein